LACVQAKQWCPFCVNKQLCKDDCDYCYNKSFATIPKSSQWSDKNELKPKEVFKSSGKPYLFNCDECKHEINMSLCSVTEGSWCSYCINHKLCNDINCEYCYNKSMANDSKGIYWSDKNELKPHMVGKNSKQKFIFDCPDCNKEYISKPMYVSKGTWCGCTTNKTEKKLYDYLTDTYEHLVIEKEKKFDWCKNVYYLPFDFCLEEYKLIIECDGLQHFTVNTHFKSTPEERQETDKYKMIQAKANGYSIIRIFQKDILHDRNDWDENLKDAILKASQLIGNPIIIYIGKMYKTHYFTID
jgi:very-short-patch-repair endonuclease